MVLELYNERRYQHYLDDFNDELDLARHLNERTNHFADTAPEDERTAIKASGFAGNAATLAWWKRALLRDPEAAAVVQKRGYEPSADEIAEWRRLAPAQRFARLKKHILETFNGHHDVAQITASDNAQQLPPEKELSSAQQQALIQERDRQAAALEKWGETA